MDAATQKFVDEAREEARRLWPGDFYAWYEADRVPLLQRDAFVAGAQWTAAQRPPVSPEVIEELRWLCHTGGLNAEGEQDGDLLAEEILARFSLPSQPVYDEEKVLRALVEAARGPMSDGEWAISRTETHSAARVYAAALVAALRGGELTVDGTSSGSKGAE